MSWDYNKGNIQTLTVETLKVGTNPGAAVALTATPAQMNLVVQGVAAGYKLARGVAAITGTGTVTHGLTTIVAVVVTLKSDPALTGTIASATWSGTTLTLKVWKPTSSSDTTPIASVTATDVNWVAIGT